VSITPEEQSQEIANLIGKLKPLLQDQSPEKALEVIARSKLKSPWITNAMAVCQLRLGNAEQAAVMFRTLVAYTGVQLKPDAPLVFKTNYAAALLASNNLAGCLNVLHEVHAEEHATVRQLRAAIQGWKHSLSFREKMQWYLGDYPQRPVRLDFPLGELE
jgi:predicted Zn-dependent protease